MSTYRIEFERIGRKHDVAPLVAAVDNADHLAEEVYRYARPHLLSQDVEVVVDLVQMCGSILCGGFHIGGRFSISEVSDAAQAVPA